jgi:lipopolysaccharide transport system permease protein
MVFVLFDYLPPFGAMMMIPALIPLIFFSLGVSFLLSIANLAIRDIANGLGFIMTIGMFAAPVFYLPPDNFPFSLVNYLNPASPTLIATQELLAYGRIVHAGLYIWFALISVVLFIMSWRVFHITMPRIAERA